MLKHIQQNIATFQYFQRTQTADFAFFNSTDFLYGCSATLFNSGNSSPNGNIMLNKDFNLNFLKGSSRFPVGRVATILGAPAVFSASGYRNGDGPRFGVRGWSCFELRTGAGRDGLDRDGPEGMGGLYRRARMAGVALHGRRRWRGVDRGIPPDRADRGADRGRTRGKALFRLDLN